MKTGHLYPTSGYELAAHLTVFEGGGAPWMQHVVVYHNNSSHYLLFWKEQLEDNQGVFIASIPYAPGEDGHTVAYHAALTLAFSLAKDN